MSLQVRVWSLEFRIWRKQFFTAYLKQYLPTKLQTPYSILMLLSISACGFQPVYGTASNIPSNSPINSGVQISVSAGGIISTSGSSNTAVDNSANISMSRQFTNNLEDLLNSSSPPDYKLEVALTQSSAGIGVARDGTASRYNLIINSNYKLTRISDDKLVDSGTISNVTSYNNPNNQYFSTYISEQDARKRGIAELAELYRQRMISFTEKTTPPILPPSTKIPVDEDCPESC